MAYLPSPERRRANWGGGIDSEEESSGETTTGTADTTNEADTSEPLPSQEKEPEPAQNVNTLSLEPAMSPLSETPGTQKIEENFDSLSDLWGMTGDLAGSLSLADGNSEKYLRVNGTKLATKTASKTFEDVPNMKTAKVSFTWYTTSLTSDSQSGRPGITLKSGDTEIISLYMSEWRPGNPGDAKKQAKKAYYSTQDKPVSDETEIKSVELTGGEKVTHAVVISLDFEALEAKVSIDGSECLTTEINSAATKVDTFMINMAGGAGRGKTYDPDMGIDDFSMEYTDGSDIERAPNVAEVNALADVTATKSDYETGFAHYDKVNVTLSDGTTKELEINKESWKPDKDFVENEWGTYVWEADLVLPEDGSVTNPLGLKAKYTMEYMSDFLKTDIDSLVMPQPVNVTRQEWESGSYTHPATVAAKLVNTSIITVPIDQASWTCEPKFDVNTKGSYVWTAELKAPAGNRNHRGLKVSYTMNYYGNYVSNHDYENDFTFGQIDWDVWGKDVDQESGTGGYEFKVKEEDGNSYLYAEVEKSGSGRGSRLDLSGDIVKSAVMEFDWRPEIVNGGHADLLFMSPAAKQNYFTLYADTSGAIHYYTKPDANNTSVIDSAFEGVIAEGDAVAANVGALNEWVTVKVAFDYIEHTAAVTVTSKKDSGKTYTAADIPISPDANGLSLVVMRKPRDCSKSGNALDNIYVDYGKFDGMDIVSVINPKDINMTMSQYPSYQFPKEVTVKLGDGSQTVIPVENWTSVPVFDESKEGVYKWSASLVPGKYTNFFKLNASFTMNYMEKNYHKL